MSEFHISPGHTSQAWLNHTKSFSSPPAVGTLAPRFTRLGTQIGETMKKLDNKVPVITGGTSGMGLATAKRFVAEGAYVFIMGRRQHELDAAVKDIGTNVTGVRGDIAKLPDL